MRGIWRYRWAVTPVVPTGFWVIDEVGGPGGVEVDSRKNCDDLIALLTEVRERLP